LSGSWVPFGTFVVSVSVRGTLWYLAVGCIVGCVACGGKGAPTLKASRPEKAWEGLGRGEALGLTLGLGLGVGLPLGLGVGLGSGDWLGDTEGRGLAPGEGLVNGDSLGSGFLVGGGKIVTSESRGRNDGGFVTLSRVSLRLESEV